MEQVDITGGINMNDNINNPSHYQGRYGMESIDALRNFMTDERVLSRQQFEIPAKTPK